jgi:hypothetical protein
LTDLHAPTPAVSSFDASCVRSDSPRRGRRALVDGPSPSHGAVTRCRAAAPCPRAYVERRRRGSAQVSACSDRPSRGRRGSSVRSSSAPRTSRSPPRRRGSAGDAQRRDRGRRKRRSQRRRRAAPDPSCVLDNERAVAPSFSHGRAASPRPCTTSRPTLRPPSAAGLVALARLRRPSTTARPTAACGGGARSCRGR